jgi:hypothetical protein
VTRQRRALRVGREPTGAALAAYVLLSVLLFGVRVLAHPGRTYVGGLTTDPQVVIWSMAWWPHAVLHGLNPLVTKELWVPEGVNLVWAQTAPGLAIALAPLTLAAGPIVAYNVAALLMPAFAAWAAFLLCRYVTNATWPSLVGGYVFGFSTYVLGGTLAHVQTTAVFPVPLIALVVLQAFEGKLGRRALVFRLGVLLAAQGLLETEILFTTTLALAVALVLLALFVPNRRGRLLSLAAPFAGAYGLAAVLLSPLLYYAAAGASAGRPPLGNDTFVADALNVVLPTHVEAIGWWAGQLARDFPGNEAERGTYIGIPALIIVALFARRRWQTDAGRFLLVAFMLGVLTSFGSWLTVDGRRVITLPWIHLAVRPPFEYLMPVRFSLFTALVTAVIVTLWIATTTQVTWIRFLLPTLVVLALAPNVSLAEWAGPATRTLFSATPPTIPALFTGGGYRHCLRKNEVVLALPFGARGNSLIWQAKSGFWFRLAGGYIWNTVPLSFQRSPGVASIATNSDPSVITLADVRAFTRKASVTSIVLNAADSGRWRTLLARLGAPLATGGVLIYRVPSEWSAGRSSHGDASRARLRAVCANGLGTVDSRGGQKVRSRVIG